MPMTYRLPLDVCRCHDDGCILSSQCRRFLDRHEELADHAASLATPAEQQDGDGCQFFWPDETDEDNIEE